MDQSCYWHIDGLIICAHVGAPSQKASRINVSTHLVLMGKMSPLYIACFPGKLAGPGQITMPVAKKIMQALTEQNLLDF